MVNLMRTAASGRVSVVTGGTDGIGRAVALRLASGGDRVIFVGRSAERGAQVLNALQQANPLSSHAFIQADLSLLTETARVAAEISRLSRRVDAAVFCAGILSTVPEWTSEGLERNLVLNYLTRYLLASLLLPALSASESGRLVLVSNAGNYADTLDFDDLQHRNGKPGLQVSGRTQFANDLLAVELHERLRDTRIQVTCVYPGVSRTGVFRNARGLPWIARKLIAPLVERVFALDPDVAADTPVFLAQDPLAADAGGRFFGPRRKERPVPARAKRRDRRSALWNTSKALVRRHLTVSSNGV